MRIRNKNEKTNNVVIIIKTEKKKRIKQKHFYCFVFAKTQNIRLISHTHFNIKNNKKTQIRKIYII